MQLETTFRNVSARPEVKTRAEHLFAKLEKFLDPAATGHLIVSAEHGKVILEIVVKAAGGTYVAKEEDEELRNALDLVFHTIENQLRRAKDRKRSHRERGPDDEFGGGEATA